MPSRRVSFSETVNIIDHIHFRDMSVEEHRSSFMDEYEMRQIRTEVLTMIDDMKSNHYHSGKGGQQHGGVGSGDDSSIDTMTMMVDEIDVDELSDEFRGLEMYCNDRMDELRRKGHDAVMRAQRYMRSSATSTRRRNSNPEVIATIYRTITKDSKILAEKLAMKDFHSAL